MEIKLVNSEIKSDFIKNLLKERGINDVDDFLNPTEKNLQSWKDLDDIYKGIEIIKSLLKKNNKKSDIALIIDSDLDGVTSSAIIYQYLQKLDSFNIDYYIHSGKQHGLEDMWEKINNASYNYDLIICPDSSSNDGEYAKKINCPILVLDHHIVEDNSQSKNMIIINNQSSQKYRNKNLSGAGVAYQFCRGLDEELNLNYSKDYIDLAALGGIADMMSGLEIENQFLWRKGLSNIKNYFFQTLIKKQSFSMGNKITPINVAFYIVPLINALIRVGTLEEKERMFLAFIDGHKLVSSNKRGNRGEQVEVAIESVRECINAHNRQNRIKEKAIDRLEGKIFKYDLLENKVLFVELDDDDDFPSELNGLIANQLAQKYKIPTLIVRENNGKLSGSMRGVNASELFSFKNFLTDSGFFDCVLGHNNASGVVLPSINKDKFITYSNKQLKNYSFNNQYHLVNFIMNYNDPNLESLIKEIDNNSFIFSQDNSEPLIYIKNLPLKNYEIIGKTQDTLKIKNDNNIVFIRFKDKDLIENISKDNENLFLNLVGRANINYWNNIISLQIFIDDYEIINNKYIF